jgi:hypothetical protein
MARRILILAALGVAISAYMIFFKDRQDMIYPLAVSLIIGVAAYTFQYQIDQLMIRGVPQRLDADMRQMLLHTTPQFPKMPDMQQRMVEDRMKRWVIRKDFINKNEQDAPEDVKYILAWYAALLTIHQESYLYECVDRIVFYHHPFLSPRHTDDVHISEVESEDGTLIISVPHLIRGHMEKGFYNIALHAIAETYASCYLKEKISWPNDIWSQLEAISSISKEQIEAYIGLPLTDPWPVAVHHQVMYLGAVIPEVQSKLPQFLAESRGHRA